MSSRKSDRTWRKGPVPAGSESTLYARKRRQLQKRRQVEDHKSFDPRPVTDDDWSAPSEDDEPSITRIAAPETLGGVIHELIATQGWASRLASTTVFHRWHEICGADLAAHCEPVRLAGGILVIRVESQVWATQLRYFIPQITQNICVYLAEDDIRDVRIVVGPLQSELN